MSKANMHPIITVIYDNNPCKEELETGWGFACLIERMEKTVLFDTGGDGQRLLLNMKKLGLDPEAIDFIVLTHGHGDHVGGLHSILEKNKDVIVYLLKSFSESSKKDVKAHGAKIAEINESMKLCESVYSTGELGTIIKEQSLIVQTEKGLIIITGCAHPGIVRIVKTARELIKDDVLLVTGGFHLGGKSKGEIKNIISDFKILGVRSVGPCHCTGDIAREIFMQEYQKNFINVGVGKVIQ